jgi:hydrogenase maturation factor
VLANGGMDLIPNQIRKIHPKKQPYTSVDLTGTEGKANMSIYTDGSKTENHIGASMLAVETYTEIHIGTQRLNLTRKIV